jgi:hypothetical protein
MLLPWCCVGWQVYTVTLHGEQLKTDFRVINTGDKVGGCMGEGCCQSSKV